MEYTVRFECRDGSFYDKHYTNKGHAKNEMMGICVVSGLFVEDTSLPNPVTIFYPPHSIESARLWEEDDGQD